MMRKRPVTLLEMLIVMALVAMIAGAVAIGIDRVLVDQRFRNEVGQIVDELKRAQDLMIILGADVHVKFAEQKDNKGIEYWLEMETKLSDSLQREVVNRKKQLKTIRGVFFKDPLNQAEGAVDLRFMSKGAVMSRGLLRLSLSGDEPPPEHSLMTFICLSGYPRPIVAIDDKIEAEKGLEGENNAFNESLAKDTYDRLPDEVKKQTTESASEPKQESKPEDNPKPEKPDPISDSKKGRIG